LLSISSNLEANPNWEISFKEIVFHLSKGDLWKVADHPDQKKYPEQKLYFAIVNSYIFIVPVILHINHSSFYLFIIESIKAKHYGKFFIGYTVE